jgi:hypothetical protein
MACNSVKLNFHNETQSTNWYVTDAFSELFRCFHWNKYRSLVIYVFVTTCVSRKLILFCCLKHYLFGCANAKETLLAKLRGIVNYFAPDRMKELARVILSWARINHFFMGTSRAPTWEWHKSGTNLHNRQFSASRCQPGSFPYKFLGCTAGCYRHQRRRHQAAASIFLWPEMRADICKLLASFFSLSDVQRLNSYISPARLFRHKMHHLGILHHQQHWRGASFCTQGICGKLYTLSAHR